ncbi:hypothetical protein [Methylobacterium sp. WL64]|uniref:hypothetical protein n=1 Tax=Methylobacterium sp. WL64 TaxID=2603894 RepID=UPI00164FE2CC|nr:hypothetical protein [Methylobacterium sp. WL64]
MCTLIYDGSNDDRWYLCRGDDPADVYVFHEPNMLSGRRSSRIELAAFFASANGSPEHHALLGMIGSLVRTDRGGLALSTPTPELGAVGAEPTPGEAATSP